MASITIRNLDERIKAPNLADAIGKRFEALGGVELQVAEREPMREPPALEE